MTSIYNLSWSEASFPAKFRLFLESRKAARKEIRSKGSLKRAEGYSALSSTYYSIVGSAFSQLKATLKPQWLIWLAPVRVVVWSLTWLPLGLWCYWRMLPLSNRVVELIGYKRMSAEECDIRQSILRRRGRYDEAEKCILTALAKNPEKSHTKGLLQAALADVYWYKGNWPQAEREMRIALIRAAESEKEDPRQAARVYRHCASVADSIRGSGATLGKNLRQKAIDLAEKTGARDQLLKLG